MPSGTVQRPSPGHAKTPRLRHRGVSCAVTESGESRLWTVREFRSPQESGLAARAQRRDFHPKVPYSNRPPDKAVNPN